MFQFESLELLYWDCWERFKIPLDTKIITVTGPNGSGKTTLLDALRTLLAAKTSEKRDYKKYARRPNKPHSWIISVVTNKNDGRGRPSFFPITTGKVTLACHINKKGGDWQRSYYILPGALSVEEILSLSESQPGPFYKPKGLREYQIELEKAGLTGAMLTVLSLEQGATDKLCEYLPKELLKLVYAAFGDKPTLDNYEKAIQDQVESERELEGLRGKVDRLESQCTTLTNKVNNYKEYQRFLTRRIKLETEVMAQAVYVDLHEGIKGMSGNILGLKRDLAQLERRKEGLQADRERVGVEALHMREIIASKEMILNETQTVLISGNRTRSAIETRLDEIKRLREACQDVEPEPLAPLQSRSDAALREKFSIEQKWSEAEQRLKEMEEEKKSLLAGRLRPERSITSFQQRLREAGIDHAFLYENVEIIDEKWRVAVESILKGFRYVLLLKNASDRWQAWKMGEEAGYRHFIVGEKGHGTTQTPKDSALAVVKLSDGVPEWIRRLLAEIQLVDSVDEGRRLPEGTTFVTAKGFIRERRGGRSIAVEGSDFAFGEAGRRKRLESLERAISKFEEEKRGLHQQRAEIDEGLLKLKKAIADQETLQQYLSRKDEESSLQESRSRVIETIEGLERKQTALYQEKREVEERYLERAKREAAMDQELESIGQERVKRRQSLLIQRRDRIDRFIELRKQRLGMPASWRTSEAVNEYKRDFGSRKDVERQANEVVAHLSEGQWETDPTLVELKEKVEKDFLGEKANLGRKENELLETRQVTHEARGAYIDYLRQSIRFYEKNLKGLSVLAGVEIETVKPNLENDDLILREAGLEIKWNFDQKGFTNTDDGEGSGGQQVIKSLILLIGLLMAEGERGGFVFIDEPFAHLDIFNIDRVADFLLATHTQYIITSPITHNANVYRPAFLTLVTRTKRPDKAFADPPAYIRRMEVSSPVPLQKGEDTEE